MNHFNKLTPAQAERLALLLEEMGEAQQMIGKILRHGYESSNPNTKGPTNLQALERELGDVRAAMIILCNAGDLSKYMIHAQADEKQITWLRWSHHQETKK